MADTIRELILQGIVSKLSLIRVTSGYNTDIGTNVIRADEIGLDAQLSGVTVAAGVESAELCHRKEKIKMPVEIVAWSTYPAASTHMAQALAISQHAEKLLGDIRKAMAGTLDRADSVQYYLGGIEDYPDPRKGEKAIIVKTEYHVHYKTGVGDPYNQ